MVGGFGAMAYLGSEPLRGRPMIRRVAPPAVPGAPSPARRRRSVAIAVLLVLLLLSLGGVSGLGGLRAPPPSSVVTTVGPSAGLPQAAGERVAPSDRPLAISPYWTNLTTGASPPPRLVTADDPSDGYAVGYAFSSNGLPLGATWILSGGVWTNISTTAGSPPMWTVADRSFAMAYDPSGNEVVAVGGSGGTWAFHAGVWSTLAPECFGLKGLLLSQCPTFGSGGGPSFSRSVLLASDPSDGTLLLLGYTSYASGSYWNWETWTYSAGRWTLDCPHSNTSTQACFNWGTNAPAPRTFSSMASAGSSGDLLFGGYTTTALNDTWVYRAGNWSSVSSANSPRARFSEALEYDPSINATLLYGGGSLTPSATFTADNDTWEFAAGAWVNVSSSGANPTLPGTSSALLGAVYDTLDAGVVLSESIGAGFASGSFTWMWSAMPPIVGLRASASPAPADTYSVVSFTGSFLGGTPPVTLEWNFGDGATAYGASASHSYSEPGTYAARLSATDPFGHTSYSSIAVVIVPSVATVASALPNPTDAGLSTVFDAGVTGGVANRSFAWSFGDGSDGGGPRPVHLFEAAGSYPVTVWVNDSGGGRARSSFVEVVDPTLSVALTATPSSPSLGQIVTFTASASGGTPGYSYAWSFGDGGTGGNLRNISHIFTTNGPFNATVRVTDLAGATSAASLNLNVALNLSVDGSWRVGATPLPVAFTSEVSGGVPGYAYAWSFGDGSTSSDASPSHTYNSSGVYEAILVVTDALGNEAQAGWAVDAAPGGGPLVAALTLSPSELPLSGTTNVTALVSGGSGGYTISWAASGVACQSDGALSETCGSSIAGVYPVRVAVLDGAGHAAVAVANITVGTLPPPHGGSGAPAAVSAELLGAVVVAALVLVVLVLAVARRAVELPPTATLELYRDYRERHEPSAPRRNGKGRPLVVAPASAGESEVVDPLGHLL